jgi:uncharacterized protein (TIRG00374 family)
MKWKRWLLVALALSVAALVAVLLWTVEPGTWSALASLHPGWLALAVGVHALSWLFWGLRIHLLAMGLGARVAPGRATQVVVASLFPAAITPAHFGGELMRIYLLKREGLSYGDATALTMGERVLDSLLLFVAFPLGVLTFAPVLASQGWAQSFLWVTVGFFVGVLALFALLLWKLELAMGLLERLLRRPHLKERIREEVLRFRASLVTLILRRRGLALAGFGCTVGFWLCEFAVPSFVLLALGLDPAWHLSMAAQSILILFVLVPLTPGGSGVMEVTAALLYAPLGLGGLLGVFLLLWRFIIYYVNLMVGALASLKELGGMSEVLEKREG